MWGIENEKGDTDSRKQQMKGEVMTGNVVSWIDKTHKGQVIHVTVGDSWIGGLHWKEEHYDLDGWMFGVSEGWRPYDPQEHFAELYK